MDINERKKFVKDIIDDQAKQMKKNIDPFPDSSVKREFLDHIENAKKEHLRRLDKL
jgi:hypothetical protein